MPFLKLMALAGNPLSALDWLGLEVWNTGEASAFGGLNNYSVWLNRHMSRNDYQSDAQDIQSFMDIFDDNFNDNFKIYGQTPTHNLGGVTGNLDVRGKTGSNYQGWQLIFDIDGNVDNTSENGGSFDLVTPEGLWGAYMHNTEDVKPWITLGNSIYDTTSMEERKKAVRNTIWDRVWFIDTYDNGLPESEFWDRFNLTKDGLFMKEECSQ